MGNFSSSHSDLRITLFYEETLLGSAGTVKVNIAWTEDEEQFLIVYADNLTDANLTKLIQFHQERDTIFTTGVFYTLLHFTW